MIQLPRPARPKHAENTIPLINIVFLLLIFFLVAGTLAPSNDPEITLIGTVDADTAQAAELVGLRADGTLVKDGVPVTPALVAVARQSSEAPTMLLYLAVDAKAPAQRLLDVVAELRVAGIDRISIVTERQVP